MKKVWYLFLFASLSFCLQAQYDNVWIFGSSLFSQNRNVLAGLDFNLNSPKTFAFPFERVGKVSLHGETFSCISDENGKLLFATDGYHIWDRNGALMPNGRGVNYKNIDTINAVSHYSHVSSASQGSLIVKVPCEAELYYVFGVGQMELMPFGEFGNLHYSLVDMRLNNGLGDVVPDQKSVLLNKGYTEHMTVVQGKGNYLWLLLLGQRATDFAFHAYKIDIRGIDTTPVESSITKTGVTVGWLLGNHQANQIAYAENSSGIIRLLNFDNETGKARDGERLVSYGAYGVSFSPNDSLLYVSSGEGIVQYELYNNLNKYIVTPSVRFSALRLGPNNKLYRLSTSSFGNEALDIISNPNHVGAACGFVSRGIEFDPSITLHGGLPNHIEVFKSSVVGHTDSNHRLKFLHCGFKITLNTTDTLTNKSTLWNNGAWGSNIAIDTSGLYVAHSVSNEECIEHVDSFWVTIQTPKILITTESACFGNSDGWAHISVQNIDTAFIKSYTWYDVHRNNMLAAGDSLVNVPGGKYWLHIHYTTCDTMIELEVPKIQDRLFVLGDTLICEKSSFGLVNISSYAYSKFEWYLNGLLVDSQRNFEHIANNSVQHQIMLIGQIAHCRDTGYFHIIVDARIGSAFTVEPGSICVGEITMLRPQENKTIRSLHWQIGKHQMGSEASEPLVYAFESAGEYTINLQTSFRACPDTSHTKTIYVYENPEVYLGNDSSICNQGSSIILKNLSNQSTGTNTYLWSTGDTTSQLRVSSPGSYSLIVKSESLGCTGYGSIDIAKDCFVDIPNAFTPNGDGVNDYFFPRKWLSNGVEKFHLQIFNRWGQLIYETTNKEGLGWDGKWNGKEQPMSVYIYRVSVGFKNGHQEQYEGNISLIK